MILTDNVFENHIFKMTVIISMSQCELVFLEEMIVGHNINGLV